MPAQRHGDLHLPIVGHAPYTGPLEAVEDLTVPIAGPTGRIDRLIASIIFVSGNSNPAEVCESRVLELA